MIARTIVDLLREGVAEDADARLFMFGGRWRSYGDTDTDTDTMAGILAGLGITRGDRVATMATNRAELIDVLIACGKLGAIQVPLNPYLKGEFLRHQLADSGATVLCADAAGIAAVTPMLSATSLRALLCFEDPPAEISLPAGVKAVGFRAAAQACPLRFEAVSPGLDDLISIIYTSGTTGRPKGCMINHGYLGNSPRRWTEAGILTCEDIQFTALPLFHTGGQNAIIGALVAHAPAVLEPGFSASEFIPRAATVGATVLRGVGSMAMALLRQPERPDDADHGFRRANFPPLTAENHELFQKRFGLTLHNQIYGQTECIPVTFSGPGAPLRIGSCGQSAPTVEVRVVDEADEPVPVGAVGEIVVRPIDRYGMFSGYWNNPVATLEAWRGLWHHTGDYGRLDEDGYFYFVDRKKDAVRRRGENVSSMELEAAICTHPAVRNAAIVAVPSDMAEDDIKAFVVLDKSLPAPEPREFFGFLKGNVPYFAMPRWVVLVGELPLTQTGRIQKHLLRDGQYEAVTEWDFERLGLTISASERRGPAPVAQSAP